MTSLTPLPTAPSSTTPSTFNAQADAFFAALVTFQAQLNSALASIGAASLIPAKNVLINGGFINNQRVYVSAAALASTAYGHDRWKAGASGGNYSFTQLKNSTQITIAANKSLIQVVEDVNVEGGSYTLSWTGTATGRVTINSATPSGNFAVSPITVSSQTAGTTMSVEFTGANAAGGSSVASNSGTLSTVKLEVGSVGTPYVEDDGAILFQKCSRYKRRFNAESISNMSFMAGEIDGVGTGGVGGLALGQMRTNPTMTISNISIYSAATSAVAATLGTNRSSSTVGAGAITFGGGAGVAGQGAVLLPTTTAGYIDFDAEL